MRQFLLLTLATVYSFNSENHTLFQMLNESKSFARNPQLAKSVYRILKRQVSSKETVVVMVTTDASSNIAIQEIQTHWPVCVTGTYHIFEQSDLIEPQKYNYFVILTSLEEPLEVQLDELNYQSLLNPRGWYLVVSRRHVDFPELEAQSLLEVTWENYFILDSLIMIQDEYHIYTWYPYHASEKKIIHLDFGSWSFPQKIPTKFFNTTLKLVTFEMEPILHYIGNETGLLNFEGPEVKLLNLVLDSLNLSHVITILERENTFEELGYKVVDYLSTRYADLFFASQPILRGPSSLLDFTISYYTSGYKWYVPCPRPFSRIKRVTSIFSVKVWGLMLISFVLVIIIMWRVGLNKFESKYYEALCNCFITVWSILLGASAPVKPNTKILRMLFLLWTCFSYAVCTVFQTFFTTFLVDPGSYALVNEVEDICRLGMEFGYTYELDNIMFDFNKNWMCGGVGRVNCSMEKYAGCMDRVMKDDKFTYFGIEFYADYFRIVNISRGGQPLCSLSGYYKTLNIVTYLTRGSHFLAPINRVLEKIIESGIFLKFVDEMKEGWRIRSGSEAVHSDPYEDIEYFVLTVANLQISFWFLGGGLAISLLVLLVELAIQF
ncbi:Ionotropic receptor 665 [Blattella germanica]|nr:Ionotropic receptor 665 [Blattella germanica]